MPLDNMPPGEGLGVPMPDDNALRQINMAFVVIEAACRGNNAVILGALGVAVERTIRDCADPQMAAHSFISTLRGSLKRHAANG